MKLKLLKVLLILLISNSLYAQKIYYVNQSVTQSGDGTSWTSAKKDLQEALDIATNDDQIWIAKGIYYPTKNHSEIPDDRNKSFYIKFGVKIYGGFIGTEKAISERNITDNPTILSGDIGKKDDDTDNAYHVLLVLNNSTQTTLNGLIITKGRATGDKYNTTTVDKINIQNALGGAIYNNNEEATLKLEHCTFRDNKSSKWGGALYNSKSFAYIEKCKFINNEVTGKGFGVAQGGAICTSNKHIKIVNSYFKDNKSAESGGAIFYYNSVKSNEDLIVNSVFINNTAKKGGAMFFYYSSQATKIVNCSFYGKTVNTIDEEYLGDCIYTYYSNPVISNSILWSNNNRKQIAVKGLGYGERFEPVLKNNIYYDGNDDGIIELPISINKGGNINKAPKYVSIKEKWDLRLQKDSPAINKGDNTNYESTFITKDILGNERIRETIDMGAYESSKTLSVDVESFVIQKNTTVYPIPCYNELTISVKNNFKGKNNYYFYDMSGKRVLQGIIGRSTNVVNTTSLKSGNYFLQIITSKGVETIRIIKK